MLQQKWVIESVSDDVLELAITGQWGAAGVAAEHHFLLEPNWLNLEQWLLLDAFSPYPDSWTVLEVSELKSYLSEEHQSLLYGLSSLRSGSPAGVVHSDAVWGLWYEFQRISTLGDETATRKAAASIREVKPYHLDACLYLIRERKVHRDYGEIANLLSDCQAYKSTSPSLRRQLADFYDGIGEHQKARDLYIDLGFDLHGLVIAYQEGWLTEFSEVPMVVLQGEHLDAAAHMVWIGIEFEQKEIIEQGLIKLQGFEEPVAWAAKGAGHLALGNPDKALEAMSNASGVPVLVLQARAYFQLGQQKSATLAIDEALRIQPWNPWIHLIGDAVGGIGRGEIGMDPLEVLVFGSYRDRYRPWHLVTGVEAWRNDGTRESIFDTPSTDEDCEGKRACWSLNTSNPEADPRWGNLSAVEQRYIGLLKGKTSTVVDDLVHERDWYATGLHKMIVVKQDNLP